MKRTLKKLMGISVLTFGMIGALVGCSGNSTQTETVATETVATEAETTEAETTETVATETESMTAIFDFAGDWMDGYSQRCHMTITAQSETAYDIIIDWANGASDNIHWEFEAEYDASQDGLVYENGRCIEQYYPEDDNDVQETEIYANGKGMIYEEDGKLYWNDATEDMGKDCIFEKMDN